MRLPLWLSGSIAGIILLYLGKSIDDPILERATDTFQIFGVVLLAVSIGVAIVALVKRR